MDAHTGERKLKSEVSSIDTALLVAGMLTARQYFRRDVRPCGSHLPADFSASPNVHHAGRDCSVDCAYDNDRQPVAGMGERGASGAWLFEAEPAGNVSLASHGGLPWWLRASPSDWWSM